MDPAVSPGEIKLILDDSPWGRAAEAAGMVHRGGEPRRVASEILALRGRIEDAGLRRDIKKAVKEQFIE
jgi:hypothetical protein